jgi:hypothetical protein
LTEIPQERYHRKGGKSAKKNINHGKYGKSERPKDESIKETEKCEARKAIREKGRKGRWD